MSINNEFLLEDRLQKIRQIVNKYGEENFYISYSGGKDSTVLHELIDLALPNNNIPRVYANTGIELNMIRDFVFNKTKNDNRFVILTPRKPIKTLLELEGYPFKSKIHAMCVNLYQTDREKKMWQGYMGMRPKYWYSRECPKILRYQFSDDFKLRISDRCCYNMKEEPLQTWAKVNNVDNCVDNFVV